MERKRKKADHDKRHIAKVTATGRQDTYREQWAQMAEEVRSKQTAAKAELEAKLMMVSFFCSCRNKK